MNLFIIGFPDMQKLNKGYASWSGEYYRQILEYTDSSSLSAEATPSGIGYITGKANDNMTCFSLIIESISEIKGNLTVRYICDDEIKQTAREVKSALRESLRNKHGTIINLPFAAAVPDNFLDSAPEQDELFLKIKKLKAKNDWAGIYRLFGDIECIENKDFIWNNRYLLDNLSFASAKLSESCINLKREFRDDGQRKKYIEEKRNYRELTKKIRKRLIKLNPSSPGYYSNLAYSYYQSCRELSFYGGRRDCNIYDEAKKALEYIEKALEIEPNRITDLYRKGQLLTAIMPDCMLFGAKTKISKDMVKDTRKTIEQGISSFRKSADVYRMIPLIDEKSLIRYRKEFVRSLYDAAKAYSSLVRLKFSYLKYFEKRDSVVAENKKEMEVDERNNQFALEFISECINEDNRPVRRGACDIITIAETDGIIEGVFKLYCLGKYNFEKYLILTEEGRGNEAGEFLIKAERYFDSALRIPYPKEKALQNKNFIKEKYARVLIEKKEYRKAVQILKPVAAGSADYYIRYTYGLSLFLLGDKKEAVEQIMKALEKPKQNKDIELGKKMIELIRNK